MGYCELRRLDAILAGFESALTVASMPVYGGARRLPTRSHQRAQNRISNNL